MRSGALESAINDYKYKQRAHGWALIFGRILVGFLDQRTKSFDSFDLIVASPTFVGEGGRTFDHTRLVLEKAAAEAPPGESWPFDLSAPPVIIKTALTEPLMGKTYRERLDIAVGPLRDALSVPDPARTRGLRILVYDDVFTDGRTLDEVARALRLQGGAETVCGVTLCRQPWRGTVSLSG